MNDILQTKPELGAGIYTVPDIALILGIPYSKALRWLNSFWGDHFAKMYDFAYSWNVGQTKAVNFHTLIELFTFYQLSKAGVSARELIKAHDHLSEKYNTAYPFASKVVLDGLRTYGKKILFELKDGSIYALDKTLQFKLEFIKDFIKNLDFDSDSLAARFWPAGKNKPVVCDPHHQFGQPVINGTNINVESLYELYKGGEPEWFIAELYSLDVSKVKDAILFCKKAA